MKNDLPSFRLEEYLERHEFSAPYLLCCSDAETMQMTDLLAAAGEEETNIWQNLKLGYTHPKGSPILREQIASCFYPGLSMENILVCSGAEEGILVALLAICQTGDHVICLTPAYQSLTDIPRFKGIEVTEVALHEENHWRLDLYAIASAIKPNTRGIILNFPHNPTGQVLRTDELNALVELIKPRGIWLFSDEVYRLLGEPKEGWALPAACHYDRALSLGVMSKSMGMAGLRIGWLACQDADFLQQINKVKHYASICASAPSEILAIMALRQLPKILARNNAIVASNLSLLDTFFTKHNDRFSWIRPEGGCVGYVRYHEKKSIETFCSELLASKGVLLLPSTIYGAATPHFRIGFGRSNMPISLSLLDDFLLN